MDEAGGNRAGSDGFLLWLAEKVWPPSVSHKPTGFRVTTPCRALTVALEPDDRRVRVVWMDREALIPHATTCLPRYTAGKEKAPTPFTRYRGNHLYRWAWEDSNLRPHAYQAFKGPLSCPHPAGPTARNLGIVRNLPKLNRRVLQLAAAS